MARSRPEFLAVGQYRSLMASISAGVWRASAILWIRSRALMTARSFRPPPEPFCMVNEMSTQLSCSFHE